MQGCVEKKHLGFRSEVDLSEERTGLERRRGDWRGEKTGEERRGESVSDQNHSRFFSIILMHKNNPIPFKVLNPLISVDLVFFQKSSA